MGLAELDDQSSTDSLANIASSRIGIDSNGSLYWRAPASVSVSQAYGEVDADARVNTLTALRRVGSMR
jgi:hypothetical protein